MNDASTYSLNNRKTKYFSVFFAFALTACEAQFAHETPETLIERDASIVGGNVVNPNEAEVFAKIYSSTVQIFSQSQRGMGSCTGVAISRTHVLTAKHCIAPFMMVFSAQSARAHFSDDAAQNAGSPSARSNRSPSAPVLVSNVYVPKRVRRLVRLRYEVQEWLPEQDEAAPEQTPKQTPVQSTEKNDQILDSGLDLAMLKMAKPLPREVSVAKLTRSTDLNDGRIYISAGFGLNEENQAGLLKWVQQSYIGNTWLGKVMTKGSPRGEVISFMGIQGGVIFGDSGGPVFELVSENDVEVVGIHSTASILRLPPEPSQQDIAQQSIPAPEPEDIIQNMAAIRDVLQNSPEQLLALNPSSINLTNSAIQTFIGEALTK